MVLPGEFDSLSLPSGGRVLLAVPDIACCKDLSEAAASPHSWVFNLVAVPIADGARLSESAFLVSAFVSAEVKPDGHPVGSSCNCLFAFRYSVGRNRAVLSLFRSSVRGKNAYNGSWLILYRNV